MKDKFSGVFTALVTPFLEGDLDLSSYKNLMAQQVDGGVDGFVVNGTTGESPSLLREEVRRVFECAKESTPESFPIVLGTGSNSTQKTIETTQVAEEWGADAALVVVPYYNKPTQKGLVQHFTAVANATKLPVILYNVPGRTITSLELDSIQELSQVENIIGIKEATGDVDFGQKIRQATYEDFLISSGDDATCVELAETVGDGVISVISHIIPTQLKNLMNEKNNSDFQEKFGALLNAVYAESNPIGIKRALFKMGIIDTDELRLPMTSMSKLPAAKLDQVLQKLEMTS